MSSNPPNLLRNRITKLNLNTSSHKHMNPKPLGITQPIIRTLNLREAHLPSIHPPYHQIRHAAAPGLVLLRHDFAYRRKGFAAETGCDLEQVVQREGPVEPDGAGLEGGVLGVDCADEGGGFTVDYLDKPVVYFGGA